MGAGIAGTEGTMGLWRIIWMIPYYGGYVWNNGWYTAENVVRKQWWTLELQQFQ